MNIFEVVNRIEKMETVCYKNDNRKAKILAKIGWLYPRYIVPLLWVVTISLVWLKWVNWYLIVYVITLFLTGRVLIYTWWSNLRKQNLVKK